MTKTSRKLQLILDTNIVQYGCDGKYSDELLRVLTELKDTYEFAASSITTYEFFAGLSGKKGIQTITKGNIFFETLKNIPIEHNHLRIAAALRTSYKCNELTKAFEGSLTFPDGLIGATAISLGAHILTGNSNDFPSPFFDESRVFVLKPATEREQKIALIIPDVRQLNSEMKRIYSK